MRIRICWPGGIQPVRASSEDAVGDVQSYFAQVTGRSAFLTYRSKPLRSDLKLKCYGIMDNARLAAHERMLGGSDITLTIKPRLQKDRWSLYWKESMETKTELLDDISLSINLDATINDIQLQVRQKCSWEPTDKLTRLEGFKDPWEFAIYKGRPLKPEWTLQECGITEDACITTVRRALVPEGWKIIQEGEDDLSSSDDDF